MILKPYGYQVLDHFEQKRYFKNGLTISFLIDSIKIIEPGKPLQLIESFLYELKESEYSTTIMKCDNIGEYILGLLDHETKSIMLKSPSRNRSDFESMVITDGSFRNVSSFNATVYY